MDYGEAVELGPKGSDSDNLKKYLGKSRKPKTDYTGTLTSRIQ